MKTIYSVARVASDGAKNGASKRSVDGEGSRSLIFRAAIPFSGLNRTETLTTLALLRDQCHSLHPL